jgi:hypothetical protein
MNCSAFFSGFFTVLIAFFIGIGIGSFVNFMAKTLAEIKKGRDK